MLVFLVVGTIVSQSLRAASSDVFIDNTVSFTFSGGSQSAFVRVVIPATGGGVSLTGTTPGLVYPENAVGVVIGDVVVTGLAGAASYSVSDYRFEVVAGQLRLRANVAFDFEVEPSVPVTVVASDGVSAVSGDFIITVADLNEAPAEVFLNNNYVPAASPGQGIGQIIVVDQDGGDTFTYGLSDGRFVIDPSGKLSLAPGIALGVDENVNLTIQVTDSGGLGTILAVQVTSNPDNKVVTPTASTLALLAPDTSADSSDFDLGAAVCGAPLATDLASGSRVYQPPTLPGPVKVNTVDAYAVGDPIFFNIVDSDQNLNPFTVDSIQVVVRDSSTGDEEAVVLTETSVDSGSFAGYVYSSSHVSGTNDCVLSVAARSQVIASYVDPTDPSDKQTLVADIAPVNVVFDDVTGEAISGIIVTLIDISTGRIAAVSGDGPAFAAFPAALRTGDDVLDKSGAIYPFGPGEFRFPAIGAGTYRLEILNSSGVAISSRPDDELQTLAGGSASALTLPSGGKFALSPASRGEPFTVKQGALPRIDIPVRRSPRVTEPTPSRIEFLQYSPDPRVGTPVNVQESRCVAGQTPTIRDLYGDPIPVPGLVNLVSTQALKAGEPAFARVTDADQNQDPLIRERITIQLDVAVTGDREFLELQETEPDSGVFVGYVQTVQGEAATGNCLLGVEADTQIATRYVDSYDSSDFAESFVLVDPYGVVFSTTDGVPIDGVSITLIDVATGLPAEVFGDGPDFALYPSTLVTGGSATDAAGHLYEFPPGEYRFPFVAAGQYRLVVADVPEGYLFPSVTDDAEIQLLPGAPYEIGAGSRGGPFEVPVGPALKVDIPIDPIDAELLIRKTASKATAAIGDFVQYEITIEAIDGGAAGNIVLSDRLPVGFRYQRGSLKVDGVQVPEPRIGVRGRELEVDLTGLVAGGSLALSYVTEVTAGAVPGPARNFATATGVRISNANVAEATVFVTEDLLRNKSILIGRVSFGSCGEMGAEGVPDVRLYLEDGTSVITDSDGSWHIEGVNPGTHVLQFDIESLDPRYAILACDGEPRSAGRSFSRFLDVSGGTLWRSDFYITDAPPPESRIELNQAVTAIDDSSVEVRLLLSHPDTVELSRLDLFYRVPGGWTIDDDSMRLDGRAVRAEKTMIGLRWPLEPQGGHELRFTMAGPHRIVTAPTEVRPDLLDPMTNSVLRPGFELRSARLGPEDEKHIRELARSLATEEISSVEVLGHTDNVPIARQNRGEFSDNYALSKARAESVAVLLVEELDLRSEQVRAEGLGPDVPVASNETVEGRQANRRVEIFIEYKKPEVSAPVDLATKTTVMEEPIPSSARVMFGSVSSPKVMMPPAEIDLRDALGSPGNTREKSTFGIAKGSWDSQEEVQAPLTEVEEPLGILSYRDNQVLSNNIHSIRVKLASELLPRLYLDGQEVSRDQIGFTTQLDDGTTIYNYIGVDIGNQPGSRAFRVEGLDRFGKRGFTEQILVYRSGEIAKIRFVGSGDNVADGNTPVRARIQLLDSADRVVKSSVDLEIRKGDLLPLKAESDRRELIIESRLTVNADGLVSFDPVSRGGIYRMRVGYNQVEQEFDVLVKPEVREWILVGLAEGTVGFNDVAGDMDALQANDIAEDYYENGRVAFFSRGTIKGEYLLTMAYDSAKEKEEIFGAINPGKYYTLYGDASSQSRDAPSANKLYVRIEKESFNAVAGDFSTNLNATELGKYSRSLTGIYSEYYSDLFNYVAFATETTQAFVRDDLRGNGTSGIYRLSRDRLVENSEQVTVEVRDGDQNQLVISRNQLSRGLDYSIDYARGELIFKEPVFSQDEAFNPQFIVTEYEVDAAGDEKLTVGGRFSTFLLDRKLELGTTLITEETEGREADLQSVDATYRFDHGGELRGELGQTEADTESGPKSGRAYLLNYERRGERFDVDVYVRDYDSEFGIGQQSGVDSGTRTVGSEVTYRAAEDAEVSGKAYRETNKESGRERDVLEASSRFALGETQAQVGARTILEKSDSADAGVRSQQLLLGASRPLGKLNLRASLDLDLSPEVENKDYPTKLGIGAEYSLTESIRVLAEQEFSFGETEDSQQTRVGLRSGLWSGAEATTTVTRKVDDSDRLAANYGIKQVLEVNEQWTFDFGVDRAQTISNTATGPTELNPAAVPVFEAPSEDFTAAYIGAGYDLDDWEMVSRFEYRSAALEDRRNFTTGVKRRLADGIVLAGILDLRQISGQENSSENRLNIGYAFRPLDSRWSILNKLELSASTRADEFVIESRKLVNNLIVNYAWDERTQLGIQYGAKYALETIDDLRYAGFTDLIGFELRRLLGNQFDVGFKGSALHSWNSDVIDYSYGVSLGMTPATNIWTSIGYNFEGFRDTDFDEADYTAKGVYLKFRFKFDQNSAKELFKKDNVFRSE